ncbi:MAG: methyltransferase domain-containing protein [Chlamydiia bacterium]|nr:methyltransferase domain-containing protein [Chlamydiia bacterium]
MQKTCELELDAKAYVSDSEIQLTLADKMLETYSFNQSARVLDVGSGDGRITSNIAQKVPKGKIIGVDASLNMVEYAKTHYSQKGFPNLEFIYEKAENLCLEGDFDNIVSFNCFHWIRPWKKTLRLFNNLLKTKGEILMLTYPKDSPFLIPLHEAAKSYPEYVDKAAGSTMFTSKELKEALIDLGLTLERFEEYRDTISYDSYGVLKDFVRIWLTSYIPLPNEFKEEFLDRFIENIKPYRIDRGDGKIHLPYVALLVHARK